jgi:hypothetical protein
MRLLPRPACRFALSPLVLGAALVAACSSQTTTASPGDSPPPTDAAFGGEEADGASPDPSGGGDPSASTFDLVVRGKGLGVQWDLGESEAEIIVAVQDDTANARVAWSTKRIVKPTDTFELSWPLLLRKGSRYRVALAGLAGYSLYTLDTVGARVVLEIDYPRAKASSDKSYLEAYDLLDTALTLAPGTYRAALPAAGTSATYIVGTKGRLHPRRIDYGCAGAAACGSISVDSDVLCGRSFVRGDTTSAAIEVYKDKQKLVGSVKPEGTGLRLTGQMMSVGCCSVAVDVLLTRASAEVEGCE